MTGGPHGRLAVRHGIGGWQFGKGSEADSADRPGCLPQRLSLKKGVLSDCALADASITYLPTLSKDDPVP